MNTESSLTSGQAALIAGLGLFVMTVCAPYAEFFVFPKLIVPQDVEATITNLVTHRGLYVSALWGFVLNYAADIVVAWALYIFLSPVNRQLSLLAALFQLVYAGLGISALMNHFSVARILDLPQYAGAVSSGQLNDQLQWLLDAYRIEWGVALIFFGIHLVLVGILLVRSGYVPRLLGYAITTAGIGYMTYMFGLYVFPGVSFAVVTVTFLFEPVFMVWLLWKGRKLS